jgi:glycosyltransferase involved in cell wall biosynthesis
MVSSDVVFSLLKEHLVLFLSSCNVTFPGTSGGDKHFVEVCRRWKEFGLDPSVLTVEIGHDNYLREDLQVPYGVIPSRWIDRAGPAVSYVWRAIAAVFFTPWRTVRPVLLYSVTDFIPDVLPAFLRKTARRKDTTWIVCLFHFVTSPFERPGNALWNSMAYLAQRVNLLMVKASADLVIVDNSSLHRQLLDLGFDAERLYVTAMGCDQGRVPGMKEKYDACFVGRLHATKGIDELLEIWSVVCGEKADARLAIVGAGTPVVLEGLLAEAERLGISGNLDFMGYLNDEEKIRVMSSSRIFVFPSHEEGFGISLLEAMCAGLPPVAFHLPHYKEIFGSAITEVPQGDVAGFARKVLALLTDRELLKSRSEECLRLSEQYSWEAIATREAAATEGAIVRKRSARC